MPLHLLVLGDPAAPHLVALARLPPEIRVVRTVDPERARAEAPAADVVLCDMGRAALLEGVLAHAPRLRWVHSVSAGVEALLSPALRASPAVLTNGRGAFKRALAEFVLLGCLYFAKDVPRLARARAAGRWDPFCMEELCGRTLGIVGYGEIGRASAALAKALGMRVTALRRHPDRSADDPLVDRVYAPAELHALLAEADYVCVAAPAAPGTLGLVDAAAFATMKPTAVLINVGRGPVVVEEALVEALSSGRIRGAALDVFDAEPLPAGHPLYALDNVLLSPHCADRVDGWLERAVDVFLDNLARFREGRALVNVVDKTAGY